MTVFDYAVLIIVGMSVLLSIIRGLVREVLALLGWVVAFVVAGQFGGRLAVLLPAEIPNDDLRLLAGFVGVFVVVLLGMSLVAMIISHLVKGAGLSVEDRILGAAFGLVRGVAIVLVGVLLAGLTALPKQPAWRNAVLSRPLQALVMSVKAWLPGDLAKRIKYD